MNEFHDRDWHDAVERLVHGDLSEAESEALRRAAADDARLARAISEAWMIQRELHHLRPLKAPNGLRRRLRQIPRRHARVAPRSVWRLSAAAITAAAALTLAVVLPGQMQDQQQQHKLAAARADLAVTFAYLERYARFTGRNAEHTLKQRTGAAMESGMQQGADAIKYSSDEESV